MKSQIVGSMRQFASGEARFLCMFICRLIILAIETDVRIYTIDKVMRQAQGVACADIVNISIGSTLGICCVCVNIYERVWRYVYGKDEYRKTY